MEDDSKQDSQKRAAGEYAAQLVEDGQLVGLGTGSTTAFAIKAIGRRVAEGLRIKGVPTSVKTQHLAEELGIPLLNLNDAGRLDITIDGADRIDYDFNMIKGGGGALIREKLVALCSHREVIIVDEGKVVSSLADTFPVPVEVLPFGWKMVERRLVEFGGEPVLRTFGTEPFLSDNGNYVLDCRFRKIADAASLERSIKLISGVVDCGLFIGLADTLIIGSEAGVQVRESNRGKTVELP